MHGISDAASGLAAGLIVDRVGYAPAFLAFAAAAIALLALILVMPETATRG